MKRDFHVLSMLFVLFQVFLQVDLYAMRDAEDDQPESSRVQAPQDPRGLVRGHGFVGITDDNSDQFDDEAELREPSSQRRREGAEPQDPEAAAGMAGISSQPEPQVVRQPEIGPDVLRQQFADFNALMKKVSIIARKLNEFRTAEQFQGFLQLISALTQNEEYIRHKNALKKFNLEEIRLGREKNLSFADLRNVDLRGCDLSGANLIGANLSGANLENTNLTAAVLIDTNLEKDTRLINTILSYAVLINVNMNGTNIAHSYFNNSYIEKSCFNNTTIKNSDFSLARIKNLTKFENVSMDHVLFRNAKIETIKFVHSVVKNSDFTQATLNAVQFILNSEISDTHMNGIVANLLLFDTTQMLNVDFAEATLQRMIVRGQAVVGRNLNFSYATIQTSCFLGNVVRRGDANEDRTQDIEHENPAHVKVATALAAAGGLFAGGAIAYNAAEIVKDCGKVKKFTMAGLMLGGPVGAALGMSFGMGVSGYYALTRGKEYLQKFDTSNINSILYDTNFHGANLSSVKFSNLKFYNCGGFETFQAPSCVFYNVSSSDGAQLNIFKSKGACVNGAYSDEHANLFKNDDPFLERMVATLFTGMANAFGGAVGGAVANAFLGQTPKPNSQHQDQ